MSRRGSGGAGWAKRHRANLRHMRALAETDARDVGGLRVDLSALLAAPVEDVPEYDLDTVVARRDFQMRARAWFARAA